MIRLWRREPRADTPDALAPLLTRRLRLVVILPEMLEAESEGNKQLSDALRVVVPAEWPPEHWEPHVRRFIRTLGQDHPSTLSWHRYIVLRAGRPGNRWQRVLVGCTGAFPRTGGDVELGYSILPNYQRRGFASEAAVALTEWLLAQDHVRSVSAQTYETLQASVKVMRKAGMNFVGAGDEAGTVRYRRMREG